jgi:propane 2-monooxygenase small subunit
MEAGPGPPTKSLGNGAGRRGDEPERSFQWYTPKKRRATMYEDVTMDTQPSIHRHLDRGWPVHFEDGRGLWSEDSTRLRATDWYDFRDPGQMWERPFYQAGTSYEQLIEGAVRTARRERVFSDFDPEWVDFLRKHLQVPAFIEHGIWLALASASRDTLSDTVTHCVALEAAMKQRQAQALLLYGMDLEEEFGDFPVDRARESFLTDDVWQPARRYVERLRATPDWGERVIAANLCFEPTVGLLIRRELLMRSVRFNGDIVTQAVSHVAQLEWEWVHGWTAELVKFLLDDETHREANREVLTEWLADWLPLAGEAAQALEPVFDELPAGIGFEDARTNTRIDFDVLCDQCGVSDAAALAGGAK